jgi:hypothetical protein
MVEYFYKILMDIEQKQPKLEARRPINNEKNKCIE